MNALRFLLDYLRLAIVVALLALLVLGVPAGVCLAVWWAR